MKKFIPYILSYFIVASCVVTFERIFAAHMRSSSSQYVVVDSSLSHDELVAKLKQAGLPEASEHILKLATFYAVVHRFAFLAVLLAACSGFSLSAATRISYRYFNPLS
jgi:Na+/proline symporter